MANWLLALTATILLTSGNEKPRLTPAKSAQSFTACAADPALASLIGQLKIIVTKRDSAGLLSLLSPDVTNDFGGDGGITEFKAKWDMRAGANSAVWAVLGRLQKQGCLRNATYAAMPPAYMRAQQAGSDGQATWSGYRLVMQPVKGKWRITALVAGD